MNAARRKVAKRPTSLDAAVHQCLDHALAEHNRGAKRVAELCGLKLDTLYKQVAECRLPINLLAPFEAACGAHYITEYLCASAHLLAVEMPVGRRLTETDVMTLQGSFGEAVGTLVRFYQGAAGAEETVAELTALMGEIGWHRANVERAQAPELGLFEGERK